MKKTYAEKEITMALQILLDLSDLLFDPESEYNDQSAKINDVASLLDERRLALTEGDIRSSRRSRRSAVSWLPSRRKGCCRTWAASSTPTVS